jgi:chromosome segregation ATPase
LRRCGGAPDAVKEEKMIRGENLGDLQQELEDLRAENTEKDSIICNLRSDIKELEDGQDELNETNRNLYSTNVELEAKNAKLKTQLDKICRKYDALLDEVALLREDKK